MEKFPILKIPDVVFREVTSMMTPIEIIKLSMTDFKMELLLRNRKCRINAIHTKLRKFRTQFDIKTSNGFPSVMFQKTINKKMKPITQLVQLQDRYQKEIGDDMYLTYVSLEEMFSIYSSLSQLFSCPFHNWILRLDELKFKLFWEYTERILTLEFHRFTVRGGEMSNKSLAKLMDKIPENASFVIDSDISLDYSHTKALKFRSVEYEEARWLKLENLFSIRNSFISKFWKTNFDCSDVNKFLNYWSDCDKDMMEELTITLKEGTQIDEQELIKNLIVIYHNTDGYTRIFIKPRNMGNRKYVVAELRFREEEKEIKFLTWDPFTQGGLYEYLVLKLVHKKRECEEKIRILRAAEKWKLQLELEELERKLAALNRTFVI